jgi:cyclic beta-1,2-glucan synthetase
VGPILLWLDSRLGAQGTTADEIVRAEHQDQTAMTVTVRNVITSMRLMSTSDWNEFFESVSLVDEALRESSDFGRMDFATRDYYRHAIEELSRGTAHSEIEIARRAVQRAKQARAKRDDAIEESNDRIADPGYYLIAEGRLAFERELGFRVSWRLWFLRLCLHAAVPGYLGLSSTAAISSCPNAARQVGITPGANVDGFASRYLPPDLAVALINRAVTVLFGPANCHAWSCAKAYLKICERLLWSPQCSLVGYVKDQVERLGSTTG